MSTESQQQSAPTQQKSLSDIDITNENVALNVMVGMLNMAQRRGAFSLEESSKCWECVRMFMRQSQQMGEQDPAAASASVENEVMSHSA